MKKKEIYAKCDLGDHIIVADTVAVPASEYVVTEITLKLNDDGQVHVRYQARNDKVGLGYGFSNYHIGKTVFLKEKAI